ncbi:MAG: thioredoxin family protein [Anaerolineales bacterium]|nr:thioredoxin family protein [Anaerolineales bacterium]
MAPIVHGLEVEYYDRVGFAYLDIDDPATAPFRSALGYRLQPHFFLLDGQGNVVREWLGYVSPDDFRTAVDALLGQ